MNGSYSQEKYRLVGMFGKAADGKKSGVNKDGDHIWWRPMLTHNFFFGMHALRSGAKESDKDGALCEW